MAAAAPMALEQSLKNAMKAIRRNDPSFGRFGTVDAHDSKGEKDRRSRINAIIVQLCEDTGITHKQFETKFRVVPQVKSDIGRDKLIICLSNLNLEIDIEAHGILKNKVKDEDPANEPDNIEDNTIKFSTASDDKNEQRHTIGEVDVTGRLKILHVEDEPTSKKKGATIPKYVSETIVNKKHLSHCCILGKKTRKNELFIL